MKTEELSKMEIDVIGEIMNISLGAAATAVAKMLEARVTLTTPKVTAVPLDTLDFAYLKPVIGVAIRYLAGLSGSNLMLLRREDVRMLAGRLLGEGAAEGEKAAEQKEAAAGAELNDMTRSAVCEVMNQLMGASATALSELLNTSVNISTPETVPLADTGAFISSHMKDSAVVVLVNFKLVVDGTMETEFVSLMPLQTVRELTGGFMKENETMNAAESAAGNIAGNAAGTGNGKAPQGQKKIRTQAPPRPNLNVSGEPVTAAEKEENMGLIMSVPMEVSVEIGRTKKLVRDILELNKGSLVVLDKLTDEKVDLLVNGQCIAKGDVVVVDDNFGVRITEVLSSDLPSAG